MLQRVGFTAAQGLRLRPKKVGWLQSFGIFGGVKSIHVLGSYI